MRLTKTRKVMINASGSILVFTGTNHYLYIIFVILIFHYYLILIIILNIITHFNSQWSYYLSTSYNNIVAMLLYEHECGQTENWLTGAILTTPVIIITIFNHFLQRPYVLLMNCIPSSTLMHNIYYVVWYDWWWIKFDCLMVYVIGYIVASYPGRPSFCTALFLPINKFWVIFW